MIRLFILCIVFIAIAIGLAQLIQRDAGYLQIAYDNTIIESSLWAGLIALALGLLLLYWLIRLIFSIRYSGRNFAHWRQGRQARRNEAQVNQGLIKYMEGDWKGAEKTFARGAERSPTPLLGYLMAARASSAAGDSAKSAEYLQQAEASNPDAQLALGLTEAELQLDNGDYQACLAKLKRVRETHPDNASALRMSAEALAQQEDWPAVQELLPQLKKKKLLSAERLQELEQQAYTGAFEQNTSGDLRAQWDAAPKDVKRQAEIIVQYAKSLAARGEADEAESVLRSAIKRDWSHNLVDAYSTTRSSDPARQLALAEGWLKSKPDDASAKLAAGRLAMASEDWEKARQYLESALQSNPHEEAFNEYGRLVAHVNGTRTMATPDVLLADEVRSLPEPGSEVDTAVEGQAKKS